MGATTAREILNLLAAKHRNDVFVPECKFGPTQMTSTCSGRFDAFVMPRSWAHFTTIGYEIKVSRRDFLADQKWEQYLDHCHEFSFVAAPGVIQVAELPATVGMYESSKNGARLFLRRKAVRRDDADPIWPMVYILMSRTTIGREYAEARGIEFWRSWLTLQDGHREVGRQVELRLGAKLRERERQIREREAVVEHGEKRLREALAGFGIEVGAEGAIAAVQRLRSRLGAVEEFRRSARWIAESVERLSTKLDTFESGEEEATP
jgi:hypothetical protein